VCYEDVALNREQIDRQDIILNREAIDREDNILNHQIVRQSRSTASCIYKEDCFCCFVCVGCLYALASVFGGLIISIVGLSEHVNNPFYIIWASLNLAFLVLAWFIQMSDLAGCRNVSTKLAKWFTHLFIVLCVYFPLYFILSQSGNIPPI
jgi:hypothetical protein